MRWYSGWKGNLLYFVLACSMFSGPPAVASDFIGVERVRVYEGGDDQGLKHPSDLWVAPDGRVWVLDGVSNRVVIYSGSGEFLATFGQGGTEPGELSTPLGMAMDAAGNLYIADSGNARVQIFTGDGKYLAHIDLPQKGKMKRPDPTDVAVDDKRGLLYTVDNENHRLLVHDLKERQYLRTVGRMSHAEEGFRWPFTLYPDEDGTLYVVDVINTRVRTVLPGTEWEFGPDIGGWGLEQGEFFRPKGVAVDARGRIFVSDSYLGVIQLFNAKGEFLAVLGDGKGKAKRFYTPTRLHFGPDGLLYVVEMFANRVSAFRIGS